MRSSVPGVRHAMGTVLALAAVLTPATGCYRPQAPATLEQPVRVEITANDARLVRAQGYLQQEVADALTNRLGWKVTPAGSARLQIVIEREDITSSGTDQRNTPNRWTVQLHGQVLINSRRLTAASVWTGSGYASALSSTTDDEASAIRNAAQSAALTISTWLEAELRRRQAQ